MNTIETIWRKQPILHACGEVDAITVGMLWNPDYPFVVRGMFTASRQPKISWDFDRGQLYAGLDGPVGARGADWMVMPDLTRPDGEGVELVLAVAGRGVGRQAAVCLDAGLLRDFLEATFEVVPAGAELDRYLDELTGGAA